MKWATRTNMKTDRAACSWLIRRFIDPEAEFFFFESDVLLEQAARIGARTFDAADADYGHEGWKCSFEVMLERFDLAGKDLSLDHMARIVHSSDVSIKLYDFSILEGFGMWALAQGLAASMPDDHEKLGVVVPMYEALYQWCRIKFSRMKLSFPEGPGSVPAARATAGGSEDR